MGRVIVHIENAEAYAGVGEIAANCEFDCGKTVIRKDVSAGDDGQDVHPG